MLSHRTRAIISAYIYLHQNKAPFKVRLLTLTKLNSIEQLIAIKICSSRVYNYRLKVKYTNHPSITLIHKLLQNKANIKQISATINESTFTTIKIIENNKILFDTLIQNIRELLLTVKDTEKIASKLKISKHRLLKYIRETNLKNIIRQQAKIYTKQKLQKIYNIDDMTLNKIVGKIPHNYRKLSETEKQFIKQLLLLNYSLSQIAKHLNRHVSTIYYCKNKIFNHKDQKT